MKYEHVKALEGLARERYNTLTADGQRLPFDMENDPAPWAFLHSLNLPETPRCVSTVLDLDVLFDHVVATHYMDIRQTATPPTADELAAYKREIKAEGISGEIQSVYWYVLAHLPAKITDAFNLLMREAVIAEVRAEMPRAEFEKAFGGQAKTYPSKLAETMLRDERRVMASRIVAASDGPASDEPEEDIDLPGAVIPVALAGLKGDVLAELKQGREDEPTAQEVAEQMVKRCKSAELAKHTEGYGVGGRKVSAASIRRFVKALYPEADSPMEELKKSLTEGV